MTKVGLKVICCVASSFLELEKLRKHIREKKTVLEFYLSVLQVILDIPGMELVCGEARCIFIIFHKQEY